MTDRDELERQGRPPKYPWAEWFDGDVWELQQGRDFYCTPKSFRPLAHRTARDYGGRVRTKFRPDNVVVMAFYEEV